MTTRIQTNRTDEPLASVSDNAIDNRPHLDVVLWLKTLELTQYRSLFQKFRGVEDLLDFTGRDILDLGVKNGAHRTRLVSSLTILKEKYNKALNNSATKLVVDSNMNRVVEEPDDVDRINQNVNTSLNGTLEFKKTSSTLSLNLPSPTKSRSPDDIREQYWYHGNLGRAKSEAMVLYSGQFLVRDCISKPGDYVLTSNWDGRPVHFMINRVVVNRKSTYERIMYQFEDEQYASVAALIRAYVSEKKPVTNDSMCIISEPVNRTKPLEETTTRNNNNFNNHQIKSLENADYAVYMKFNAARERRTNETVVVDVVNAKYEGLDNLIIPSTSASIRSRPLPPVPLSQRVLVQEAQRRLNHKWNSESALEDVSLMNNNNNHDNSRKMHSFGSARNLTNTLTSPRRIVEIHFEEPIVEGPPKPLRAPSLKRGDKPAVIVRNKRGAFKEIREIDDEDDYHEYCDIDYEDINAERPDSGFPKSPDKIYFRHSTSSPPPLPPRSGGSTDRDSACVPDMGFYDRPNPLCQPLKPATIRVSSRLRLSEFTSELLPVDIKPLDSRVWPEIKDLLLGLGSHRLAAGITREDYKFLNVSMDDDDDNYAFGVTSGLLLLLLPHGEQLRVDVLERSQSWKYFVVTTLMKASNLNERTELLAKWIDIARELKETYKNCYAFGNIMSALNSPHVSALKTCWQKLRTDFTELAVIYETQLRSNYADIQKCDCEQNSISEVCIPDVEPLARLLSIKQADLSWLYDWEDLDDEFGLDAMWTRLSNCRLWQENIDGLRKRIGKILDDERDTTLTDFSTVFFRSEFQMKFLWGAKGAFVESYERYPKFEKLLTLMAERCELETN